MSRLQAPQIEHIQSQYLAGSLTLKEIGRQYGVSKQRIGQLVESLPRRNRAIRRNEVYEYVVSYMTAHHGLPPTLGEIATQMTISKSVASFHVARLIEEGRLMRHTGVSDSRNLYIPGATWTPPTL